MALDVVVDDQETEVKLIWTSMIQFSSLQRAFNFCYYFILHIDKQIDRGLNLIFNRIRKEPGLARFKFYQNIIDRLAPHLYIRWITVVILMLTYFYRTYIFGHFGFITLNYVYFTFMCMYYLIHPVDEASKYALPTRDDDKIQVFEPCLPEHKCWRHMMFSTCFVLFITGFKMFQLPWRGYTSIYCVYFLVVCIWKSAERIRSMIRFGYVPYTVKPQKKKIITKKCFKIAV